MLILTRRAGEIILTTTLSGEHIEVVVLGVKGSQYVLVRLRLRNSQL